MLLQNHEKRQDLSFNCATDYGTWTRATKLYSTANFNLASFIRSRCVILVLFVCRRCFSLHVKQWPHRHTHRFPRPRCVRASWTRKSVSIATALVHLTDSYGMFQTSAIQRTSTDLKQRWNAGFTHSFCRPNFSAIVHDCAAHCWQWLIISYGTIIALLMYDRSPLQRCTVTQNIYRGYATQHTESFLPVIIFSFIRFRFVISAAIFYS